MMEYEPQAEDAVANPGDDAMLNRNKRNSELLEDAESKKSKLDVSCDATVDTEVSSISPSNQPGSPDERAAENEDCDPHHGRTETLPENETWEKFQQSTENREEVPNLESYLQAQSTREHAKKHFLTSIEIYFEGLTQTMEELLQHSVVAIHNEMEERMDTMEGDIVTKMKSNHKRRHAMRQQMDQANQAWVQQYSQLYRKIAPPEEDSINESEATNASNSTVTSDNDNLQGENGEPDWNTLGDTPSNQNKIQCFLGAREQFQNAAEVLSHDLDEIHAGLRGQVEAIIQVAVDLHDQDEKTSLALEDDIQFHLMENEKRRANLQEKLEQSAMQAQGLFANLLSRLAQK